MTRSPGALTRHIETQHRKSQYRPLHRQPPRTGPRNVTRSPRAPPRHITIHQGDSHWARNRRKSQDWPLHPRSLPKGHREDNNASPHWFDRYKVGPTGRAAILRRILQSIATPKTGAAIELRRNVLPPFAISPAGAAIELRPSSDQPIAHSKVYAATELRQECI